MAIFNGYMMDTEMLNNIIVRKMRDGEEIPYELLLDADPSIEVISTYLSLSEIYIALLQKKIIGTFVLYPVDHDTLEIKNIAVEESIQGRGIGKLLLENATQIASSRGAKKIVIGTSNASVGPLFLYQKAGFDMDIIKKNFIIENYPRPLFDNGIQCKHMIMLTKYLSY